MTPKHITDPVATAWTPVKWDGKHASLGTGRAEIKWFRGYYSVWVWDGTDPERGTHQNDGAFDTLAEARSHAERVLRAGFCVHCGASDGFVRHVSRYLCVNCDNWTPIGGRGTAAKYEPECPAGCAVDHCHCGRWRNDYTEPPCDYCTDRGCS